MGYKNDIHTAGNGDTGRSSEVLEEARRGGGKVGTRVGAERVCGLADGGGGGRKLIEKVTTVRSFTCWQT